MPISNPDPKDRSLRFPLTSRRRQVWLISAVVLLISVAGLVLSWTNPQIRSPLRPGLDFTGGTKIQLERRCAAEACSDLSVSTIENTLTAIPLPVEPGRRAPNLDTARVQLLDRGQSVVLRMPALTASQGQAVIQALEPVAGPFVAGGQSVDTIGPSLGVQLLRSSLISLLVAFTGIAIYITIRYDRRFAFEIHQLPPSVMSVHFRQLRAR